MTIKAEHCCRHPERSEGSVDRFFASLKMTVKIKIRRKNGGFVLRKNSEDGICKFKVGSPVAARDKKSAVSTQQICVVNE
ncbi:MAG: hypothetical protein IJ566_02235 [Cardiobacteriaceae bacterium]|nr:hypothetical protein [Cardiobacteriaceae bacterium]